MVRAGFPIHRSQDQYHWVALRLIQPFILPSLIKWIRETPGDLLLKNKLSPRTDSVVLRDMNPIHKVFFTLNHSLIKTYKHKRKMWLMNQLTSLPYSLTKTDLTVWKRRVSLYTNIVAYNTALDDAAKMK